MIIFFIKDWIHRKIKGHKERDVRQSWGFWMLALALFVVLNLFLKEVTLGDEALRMYSGSYALTDGNTGRVLMGKEASVPMANASTTKILTCIITLENCDLNEMVSISANASAQPKVRLGMGEGEQYPLVDLLYGLMLESYNDCAVAIAEHVAGSEEKFAKMLNAKAKEIGCRDTYFITPNGLDAEDDTGFHHTTAEDLCQIMSYCVWTSPMKDTFLEITRTPAYAGESNGNTYHFTNRNAFLTQMDGVISGKTGFTNKAGYCYVAAFERDGERFCIALLACGWPNNKTYKWKDARTLLNYGMEHYEVQKIHIEEMVEKISVAGYIDGADFEEINKVGNLKIRGNSASYEVLLGKEENIKQEIILYQDCQLPITKGQVMGVCNLYLNDLLMDQIFLVAEASAAEWKWSDVLYHIFVKFLTFSQ